MDDAQYSNLQDEISRHPENVDRIRASLGAKLAPSPQPKLDTFCEQLNQIQDRLREQNNRLAGTCSKLGLHLPTNGDTLVAEPCNVIEAIECKLHDIFRLQREHTELLRLLDEII